MYFIYGRGQCRFQDRPINVYCNVHVTTNYKEASRKQTCIAFFDFVKASDIVNRGKVCSLLERPSYSMYLFRAIQGILGDSRMWLDISRKKKHLQFCCKQTRCFNTTLNILLYAGDVSLFTQSEQKL